MIILSWNVAQGHGVEVGMSQEVLSVKTAAQEANAHDAQVFAAIRRGVLHARKQGGRTLILRDSFSQWKKRLETKRAIRQEERVAASSR